MHAFLGTGLLAAVMAGASGCDGAASFQRVAPATDAANHASLPNTAKRPFIATQFARFDEPWAMAFLPDGRLLVTEKGGTLKLFDPAGRRMGRVTGTPTVDHGGQGGLGDVVLHPRFAQNGWVYLSYAEAGAGDVRGAAVLRARLALDGAGGGTLQQARVIWRQVPKVDGRGHYSHRLAFSPDGRYLFISSGDRQHFDPAQDLSGNLGKVVRLHDDGSVPADNPFADRGGVAAQAWTLGHRNLLGLAFDAAGQLWNTEMGPRGGDELNRVVRGDNYGWPIVSDGDHYDGRDIPDHATRPEFHAPAIGWNPVVCPSGLLFYTGTLFPQWRGHALFGGLCSQSLVDVAVEGERGREVARHPMGARIREVEQGPDGALWLLEDGGDARLLKLTPPR